MVRYAPTAESGLAGHVISYWGFNVGARRRLLLPDGVVKLMFGLSGSLHLSDHQTGTELGSANSLGVGLSGRAVLSQHGGQLCGITVLLSPLAAYRIAGVPMSECANRAIPLDELFGPWTEDFRDAMAEAPTWASRFGILDRALAKRLHAGPPVHSEIAWAHEQLVRTHGRLRVEDLARDTSYSKRHLERLFRAEIGLCPKALAQILRLQCVIKLSSRFGSFAEAAVCAGYHDQAHFSRAFKAMVGWSPTEYLAMRRQVGAVSPPLPGGLTGSLLMR